MIMESIVPFSVLIFIVILQMFGKVMDKRNTLPALVLSFIGIFIALVLGYVGMDMLIFSLILLILISVGDKKW